MTKPKLLFIKHKDFTARTVDNDRLILEKAYDVNIYDVNTVKGFGFFTALISEFFFLLSGIYRYKIIFIWFADYHSLLPVFFSKLTGKRSYISIGGYDADEILTGEAKSIKEKFRKFCVKYSIHNCTKLFPVSGVIKSYLDKELPAEKSSVIHCCIDTGRFNTGENIIKKDNLVITIGGGGRHVKEALRKRLDYFIELGNEFNNRYRDYDTKFLLIGHNEDTATYNYLNNIIKHNNVILKPMADVDELASYMKKASVYMQLSYYEAFGIAQIEAMLFGCIPVSNKGGAIPDVVGDAGFIVENYDSEKYLQILKDILDGKYEELRQKARQRVLTNFTLEIREKKLLDELK